MHQPSENAGEFRNTAFRRRYALAMITIVYVFNFVDRQILAILLPAIKREFLVDDWVLGFLAGSAFALFYATLGIPIALLADRFNRRNLIAISLTVWSAMTALSGTAANVVQLAFARVGVGVGEAGYSPPAHSIIADYYAPAERSTAMGVFTLGISLGIMIAFLGGGWMAQNIGWREAFLVVGIPGLVLALLFRLTVVEPPRGLSDNVSDSGDRHSITTVVKFLLRRRSFAHLSVGAGLASLNAYAVLSFFPSFLERSHGMNLQEIGIYLGIIIGVSTGIGFLGGGYASDRVGSVRRQRSFRAISLAMLLGWLLSFPLYLVSDPIWVLAIFTFPSILWNCYQPTVFAMTQSLVGIRMRSVASALLLFLINIIGLGLGPQIAGILSDVLASNYGDESLRYSLLIIGGIAGPWAAVHFFKAGQTIDADLERSHDEF